MGKVLTFEPRNQDFRVPTKDIEAKELKLSSEVNSLSARIFALEACVKKGVKGYKESLKQLKYYAEEIKSKVGSLTIDIARKRIILSAVCEILEIAKRNQWTMETEEVGRLRFLHSEIQTQLLIPIFLSRRK